MTEGVDYAWDRPTVAGLVAAGKRFVVRYGGPGSSGKQLDAAEARALIGAGISIVANAEGAADGLLGGRTAGISWATSAHKHFTALGMPADRPIYVSVDFDAGRSHWSAIDAALRGAADVLGADRVGVYGGYDTIAHCVSAGTARWFWQTYAWSGGHWHDRAHIRQYRNHVALAGGTADLCRAMTSDYGQWGQPREDDDMDATQFLAIIKDPAVAAQLRAIPWQYLGGGIPKGMSTLGVLNELITTVRAIADRVDIDPAELEQIRAAAHEGAASAADGLVAAVLAKLPPGTLTRDDVEQAVRDAFAGGLAPETAA